MKDSILNEVTIGKYFKIIIENKDLEGVPFELLSSIKTFAHKVIDYELNEHHNILTSKKLLPPNKHTNEYKNAVLVCQLIDEYQKQIENDKINSNKSVTVRILLELTIIEDIFKSQINKFRKEELYKSKRIFDSEGVKCQGLIVDQIDIFSDTKLFDALGHINSITNKYESNPNNLLLKNELTDLLESLNEVLDQYSDFIVKQNPENTHNPHNAIVWVNNYYITKIYIRNKELNNVYDVIEKHNFKKTYKNEDFKNFCELLASFIEKILPKVQPEKKLAKNEKPEINIGVLELELFIKSLFLDFNIEKKIMDDFIRLVKAQRLKTSNQIIVWTNHQYLLLYIVQNLEKYSIIDIEANKFIIDNFTFHRNKPIEKSYLQSLNKKYSKKSDKIRTEIEESFNHFINENKPPSNKSLNIKTL